MKNMQFGPYLWPNRQNSCIIWEIGVGEHDGDVRFLTGSRNKTVLRMRNEKYAIWPIFLPTRQNCCTAQQWTCELCYGADTMFHRTYFLFTLISNMLCWQYVLTGSMDTVVLSDVTAVITPRATLIPARVDVLQGGLEPSAINVRTTSALSHCLKMIHSSCLCLIFVSQKVEN